MYPDLSIEEQKIAEKRNFENFARKTSEKFVKKFGKFGKYGKIETYVFEEWGKTKKILLFSALLMLFLTSFYGVIFMWFTEGYRNALYSNLVIEEGAPIYEMWRKPAPKPLLKIYLFNYTNVAEFEDGTALKLRVEEKGPYVYEETLERVNVEFNGTFVNYQQKKSYKFIPELSKGRQNDILHVPNMVMLTVAAMHQHANFFARLTISSGLNGFQSQPFLTLPADRFITGYDDELYSLAQSLMKLQDKHLPEKAGLLALNLGVNPDVYTMHTGKDDINQIGKIVAINGEKMIKFWSTDECNSMGGSDGSLFPPKLVAEKQPVKVFLKDMCRSFELKYVKNGAIFDGDVATHRYTIPDDVFEDPENFAKNQCFCEMEGGTCPLRGLYNTTLCSMGAPTFVSHPHFYKGDPKLLEGLDGLEPDERKHGSFLDLHPTLGFPMNGYSRIQLNSQILKSFGFTQLEKYENELILPITWFEMNLEDKNLPEDIQKLIKIGTKVINYMEFIFKYASILMALMTFVPLFANLRHRINSKKLLPESLQVKKETDF